MFTDFNGAFRMCSTVYHPAPDYHVMNIVNFRREIFQGHVSASSIHFSCLHLQHLKNLGENLGSSWTGLLQPAEKRKITLSMRKILFWEFILLTGLKFNCTVNGFQCISGVK